MTSLDTTAIVSSCKTHLANCLAAMWASLAMVDKGAPHAQEGRDALARGDSLVADIDRSVASGATVRGLLSWLDAAVRLDESALQLSLRMPGLPWVPVAQAAHRLGSAISTEVQRYAAERDAVPSVGEDYVRSLQAELEKAARELRNANSSLLSMKEQVSVMRKNVESAHSEKRTLQLMHEQQLKALDASWRAREWAFRDILRGVHWADLSSVRSALITQAAAAEASGREAEIIAGILRVDEANRAEGRSDAE